MQHSLAATPDTVTWGHFDPDITPAVVIDPGDSVRMETLSGGQKNIPAAESGLSVLPAHRLVLSQLHPELGPHIITGPIHVRGAEVGDRLVVTIADIELAQDYGWNAIEPGFGIFPELADEYESLIIPIDRQTSRARLPWGPQAKLSPFFGIVAVMPDPMLGKVGSVVPGPFGGNIDNRYCRKGCRIEFPIFAKGGGFMAGDGHALQGDGEICDTALETALNGTFHFGLEKGTAPEAPELHFGDLIITMAFSEDLEQAARDATARMMRHLELNAGLSRKDAYRHCSLFASLRITQMVNRRKGVHCVLRRASLKS